MLTGTYTEAYKSGKSKKKTSYTKGLEEGAFTLWHDNGIKAVSGTMRVETVNDKPLSVPSDVWTTWYASGAKASVVDHKAGTAAFWNADGSVWAEATQKDGVRRDSGQSVIVDGSVKDGHRHGAWTRSTEDGRKVDQTTFKMGAQTGKYKGWHGTGSLRVEGQYTNGVREGKWAEWSRYGRLLHVTCYRSGDKVWTSFEPADPKRSCP